MKKEYFIFAVVLTLVVSLGSYFVINSRKAEAEKNRLQKEEQESRKIDKKTFGYSVKGRPIDGYEIGNGADTLLLFGSIHGDEMGTADLLNKFVEEIKTNPSLISKTKKIIIIPIVNPDGYLDRTDKLNANGVNLNLNFGTSDWQKYGPEGTFAGNVPFSEPESQVIKQVTEQYHPVMMISYHSQAATVTPEKTQASIDLAKWYANKTGYTYFNDWDFPGTATKWFDETTGKPAITVELSWDLQSDWEINNAVLLELVSSGSINYKIN